MILLTSNQKLSTVTNVDSETLNHVIYSCPERGNRHMGIFFTQGSNLIPDFFPKYYFNINL